MGFLERAIRNGIRKGVSDAIGNAVQKAVRPAATELANKAKSYATEVAKNIKVCPACGEGATADKNFCPRCGAKLPEKTVADGTVCPSCGKQNTVGTKFCTDCGTKLLATVQAEQAQTASDTAVMAEWDEKLPQYPKWNQGGTDFHIEEYEPNIYGFSACFNGDSDAASRAVTEYLQYARQHGFRPAGEYPSDRTIYNKINGVCYCIDTTDCLAGDPDRPTISLWVHEPCGGFDYVKPEPKQKSSLKDLFKF